MRFPSDPATRRIWLPGTPEVNTYGEFAGHFVADPHQPVQLRIACDSMYALWIQGRLAAFSACGDYPWYKLYDDVDISRFCEEENDLRLQVWYLGEDSQTYLRGEPGAVLEIVQQNRVLLRSDSQLLSARIEAYRQDCSRITSQLGFGFFYDNTAPKTAYAPSAEYPVWENLICRGVEPLQLGQRHPATVYPSEDGYLIDLGEETVGFLELELDSSQEQNLLICYGERLDNGQVPRLIGSRDFSVGFRTACGHNVYLNPFRRLAGRYLQVICESSVELQYLGLRPVFRPVKEYGYKLSNPMDQRIYDTAVNTLRCCMHEHYEDCPWREQAMYTMDSRNQMLCGYYAFADTAFPRSMILLMAQGQHEDGLLSLCYPAGLDYPIPFFSLVYLMILQEFVQHTGDRSILPLVATCVDRIMAAFTERIDENGLIPCLPYPYWNFYEWAAESHREHEITRKLEDPYIKSYDLILNSMYVYAARIYESLYGKVVDTSVVRTSIQREFYVPEKKTYRLNSSDSHFSVLGNSMAILIGLGDEALARRLLQDRDLIPVTLSMSTFFYDALLCFGDTFRQDILGDIRKRFGRMLESATTTFWETDTSMTDGLEWSLCHGWSAIPVYYFHRLLGE